jgi:transcriptional regulator with XRE-family HTH domain
MYDIPVENASMFGRRIRRARLEKGYSQHDLARAMGISSRAVQYWESPTGTRQPQARMLRKLSEATGKPIAWFFEEAA